METLKKLTNKQINELAKTATAGVTISVDNAAKRCMSPFAICNEIKKEKSEDFNTFLTLFSLSRRAFGFNAETFSEHYVQVSDNESFLAFCVVDASTIVDAEKAMKEAQNVYELSDKGTDAKKALRKATNVYNKATGNLRDVAGTIYKVVDATKQDYLKLLKQMIRERKAALIAESDETREKEAKRAKKEAEKAQKERIQLERERTLLYNQFVFSVTCQHVEWSHDEIASEAKKLLEKYEKEQKTA